MTGPNKKTIEITVVALGLLFLAAKFFQLNISPGKGETQVSIEMPANFNFEEAKKALSDFGGLKEKVDSTGKHVRDILQKPAELTALEQKALYNPMGAYQGAPEPEEEKFSLEGIMFGGEKGNLAIISGKVVSEGDVIGKSKVIKIESDRIILSKNGSEFELKR